MKKRNISLSEHQEIIYDLLYKLDDFCKTNNIRYFLGYGSLLGAVRHSGIIPWDDDADVMMERSEYERFQELITANPPTGYKAYSINSTKGYYYPFIKFGKEKTLLVEPFKYVPKKGIGINIDVFPVDGCVGTSREDAQEYAGHFFPVFYSSLNKRFHSSLKDYSGLRGKLYYFLKIKLQRFGFFQKYYFKQLYATAKQFSVKDAKYYSCISWSFNGPKNVHSTEYIKTLIEVPFGCRKLPIPQGYDYILSEEYGDYMTPPSEKGKESTHQHEVYIYE